MRSTFLNSLWRRLDALTTAMGWFSGLLFMLLAFFMAFETASRDLGGPYTGFSDQIASLLMALGGTWSLAHALSVDAHVRIDVLAPLYPKAFNHFLRLLAFVTIGFMACVLAWQAFNMAYASWELDALVPQSMIDFPLWIPQAVTGIGFAMLALQSLVMLLQAIVNGNAGKALEQQA